MPRPRFQFRLSTLLWITLAVACWFGGIAFEKERARSSSEGEWREIMRRGARAHDQRWARHWQQARKVDE